MLVLVVVVMIGDGGMLETQEIMAMVVLAVVQWWLLVAMAVVGLVGVAVVAVMALVV